MAKKILLADDSITIQKVVEMAFRDAGFEVTCVGDASSAMRRLQESVPDIVLADVQLPEKEGTPPAPHTGYNVCSFVKANPSTAGIPVLLLRGTFEPWDPQRAQDVRADGSIIKPFDSDKLVEQVREILAQPATGAAAQGQEAPPVPSGAPVPVPLAAVEAGPGREPEIVSPSDWIAEGMAARGQAPAAPAIEPTEGGISFEVGGGAGEGPAAGTLWETPAEYPPGEPAFGSPAPPTDWAPPGTPASRVDYRATPPILEEHIRYDAPEPPELPTGGITGPPAMLSESDRRAMVEEIVARLSDQVLRELAARIVPDLAERIIRAKLEEIEKKADGA